MANDNDAHKTRNSLIVELTDTENTAVWNEFYSFYWDLITGWARSFGCNESQAKDIFQETIISLIKNLPYFKYDPDKGSFRGYLKTIVSRKVKNLYRRDHRYVLDCNSNENFDEINAYHDTSPSDSSQIDRVWIDSLLFKALRLAKGKVNTQTYKSFAMNLFDGMSINDIMIKLKLPNKKIVYGHKKRFLEIMRREFCNLLESCEDKSLNLDKIQYNEMFRNSLEEALESNNYSKNTLTLSDYHPDTFRYIETVRDLISKNPLPFSDNGGYLLILNPEFKKVRNDIGEKSPSSPIILCSCNEKWINLGNKCTFGRRPDMDIVLQEDFVSGLHADIEKKEFGYFLKNNDSSNGLFIDNERVSDGKYLTSGNIIYITPYYPFLFYIQD